MTERASIQIIILYYKEFDYFVEALSSVLIQDYSNFSILIIDDGTHDQRLLKLIDSLNDPRITLRQNNENIGLARNFELARSLAGADYVVFLGQDDILEPNYISNVLPRISDRGSIAIAQPRVIVIDELGKKSHPLSDIVKSVIHKLGWALGEKALSGKNSGSLLTNKRAAFTLLIGDFLYFPTLTWKSSLMSEFDVSRDVTLDYKMIIDVLGRGGELLLLPDRLARYRRHKRSASMRPDKMIERLQEEKSFHLTLKNEKFIRGSFLLSTVNAIRFTQRLHALQVAFLSLLRHDWKNFSGALRCFK
jgi:glycosyltransferase involved in cell wall biosynthesis